MRNLIEFNGKKSDEFNIYIENIPKLPISQMEYESTSVPGRDGTLTRKKGYKDIEIELTCWFKEKDNLLYINKKNLISNWLCNYKDNNTLKFSFFNTCYWKVKQVELSSFETKYKIARSFSVKFTLEPFCYMVSEDIYIEEEETITNPGTLETKPRLTIYNANGDITIHINNQNLVLKGITESEVVVDSEILNCYSVDSNGVLENLNHKMYTGFPKMEVGNNNISWEGSLERIKIEGRWCN